MEISFHNAYLGSLNSEHRHSPYIREKFIERDGEPYVIDTFLAFDSYSPLTCGKRGQKVGGNRLLSDKSYYGCCACIGAAGLGAMLSGILMREGDGYILGFYERGQYNCDELSIKLDTEYPVNGDISVSISSFADRDVVYTDTSASGNGWHSASATEVFHKKEDDGFFAVLRGPLVLGTDERFGKSPMFRFKLCDKESLTEAVRVSSPFGTRLCLSLKDCNGDYLVGDYASLGLDWHSDIAAWLPTEE